MLGRAGSAINSAELARLFNDQTMDSSEWSFLLCGNMSDTPLSLLERVRQQSDSHSWNRMFEIYAPLLRRWLNRYAVQDSDAEDLVQEVLSSVARELPNFEHNRRTGAFRSWLRTILVHRLQGFWRARQYQPVATGDSDFKRKLDEFADDNGETSGIWDREHDEHVMRRVMHLVQPKVAANTWKAFQRQVIDGISAADVAEEIDISLDSAYAAKSRVLRMLRQEASGLVE